MMPPVVPEITLTYLAGLALLYALLSLVVVVLRGKLNIPYGSGGNNRLRCAVRAHGNFSEWVPLIGLLVAGLEMSGWPPLHIHVLMGALLAARILHPIGLFSTVGTPTYFVGRIFGALTTWIVLLSASYLVLSSLI